MFDVVTIGAATADIFVSSDTLQESRRLLSLKRSSKNEINRSLICSGGGATNAATTFSRLGLKAAVVAQVGRDPLADYVFTDLKKEKINADFVKKNSDEHTDFSVIFVASDGSRSIMTQRGDSRLEHNDLPWTKLKSRSLYITSLEGNLSLLEELIGFAKENNMLIAFNPGSRELKQRRQLIPLLKYLDFLLLNRQEAQMLTDLPHRDSNFLPKLRQYSPLVAVTNGHLGARILTAEDSLFSPIANITPVDETGAGDAFGSAFFAALLHQQSLSEALSWAIKNSASVVSALGAKTGILTRSQM